MGRQRQCVGTPEPSIGIGATLGSSNPNNSIGSVIRDAEERNDGGASLGGLRDGA